jgi:2,4-dienoyl-CoA reductase-like NADH-dependent reductase (Old Yellow Enzyme family)
MTTVATLPASASLFEPLTLRAVTLRNRIVLSPMAQYSAVGGMAGEWHRVHYATRAVGGVGAIVLEVTAVSPEGRISPGDLGLWDDAQVAPLAGVAALIAAHGAVPGVQIGHAGRKACTTPPWQGGAAVPLESGGWTPLGPGGDPFGPAYHAPRALSAAELEAVPAAFAAAARRAVRAGFRFLEIHAAHGYLLHQFLSPLVNRRADAYGGSFENRARLTLAVTRAARAAWPAELPLWLRLSARDWAEGGWDLEEAVRLAVRLRDEGVDLLDVSSAGAVSHQQVPAAPGFQVPFAERIRHEAGVRTSAVGLITEPAQADAIVRGGRADLVMLGRVMLRQPYWPMLAAQALDVEDVWPVQYLRARPSPHEAGRVR